MGYDPDTDLSAARVIEVALREVLQKKDPDRAIGLAGCILLAARTIAVTACDKAELDEILDSAKQLLDDQARVHFATREKVARRGQKHATQH